MNSKQHGRWVEPILDGWKELNDRPRTYTAGTFGPGRLFCADGAGEHGVGRRGPEVVVHSHRFMGASDRGIHRSKAKNRTSAAKTLAAGAVIEADACPVRPHDLTHYRKTEPAALFHRMP